MSSGNTPPPPTGPSDEPAHNPQDSDPQHGSSSSQPNYGTPPPPAPQYGAPPPQQYGAPPPQQYGAPPPQQYGAPPPQQYGAAPQPYGAAPQPYGMSPAGAPPKNWLWLSIVTILFCWPLAIPAVVFSNQVNRKWGAGDPTGAQSSANKARTFALIGIVLGVIALIINVAVRSTSGS